ncbi:MAG: hypothetical protein ACKOTF_02900 [Opitutaceae bacterium]
MQPRPRTRRLGEKGAACFRLFEPQLDQQRATRRVDDFTVGGRRPVGMARHADAAD